MCTLTWWSGEGGSYEIFFNRDESKEREPALPPTEGRQAGIAYLAPIDPRGKGTWLLINEVGIGFALLNSYEEDRPGLRGSIHHSRGQLVMGLADVVDERDLSRRINEIECARFPPFRLVSFIPGPSGTAPQVDEWQWRESGTPIRVPGSVPPISSSSFETEAVIAARKQRLAEFGGQITSKALERYHHGSCEDGRIEGPDAYGVRMNRPDAQTWSISRVSIGRGEIRFFYEAEQPDLAGPAVMSEARLARRKVERGPDGALV